MLRSFGVRSGPLGVPAGVGGGSGFAFADFGSSLGKFGAKGLGARPVAPPFRQRAPILYIPLEHAGY